ncbi:MAG: response regulator transcription factor [Scrofimicrobium sp.]
MKEKHLPRLLYVEDEDEMAAIATEVLSEDYLVTHASDGETALRLVLQEPFDLMLLDRRLPGMSGTDLVAKIRRSGLSTPILLLTALGAVRDRVDGLDGGANDYLVKPFDFEELRARLRALLRGYHSQIVRRDVGEWTFVPSNSLMIGPYGEQVSLTEAEARFLDVLTSNPDHIFSRAELLTSCFPAGESSATVDSYVHYIRRKTASEVIRTVRGRGYQIGGVPQ